MHQAYKFQLYPTKTQEKLLVQIAGNCRWVWNHMLAQQIVKYQQEKKFIFAVDMANQLPRFKTRTRLVIYYSKSITATSLYRSRYRS
jgi:transposase